MVIIFLLAELFKNQLKGQIYFPKTKIGLSFPRLQKSVGSGGAGRWAPNSLLKFVDFVSENGCESYRRGNENSNSYTLEEDTIVSVKNTISF